jgi:hypothetical protein
MRQMILVAGLLVGAGVASAQAPAHDPSAKLSEVLPAAQLEHVLAVMAEAQAKGVPTNAIAIRALELAAKASDPEAVRDRDFGQAIAEYAKQLSSGLEALRRGGVDTPNEEEVEAAAEALSSGVDGATVSELASSAPSGRSLAVPLFVIASLADRGLPSDEALAGVLERLQNRASDAELQSMGGRPGITGSELGQTMRPSGAGRPAGVPSNAGAAAKPPVPIPPRP